MRRDEPDERDGPGDTRRGRGEQDARSTDDEPQPARTLAEAGGDGIAHGEDVEAASRGQQDEKSDEQERHSRHEIAEVAAGDGPDLPEAVGVERLAVGDEHGLRDRRRARREHHAGQRQRQRPRLRRLPESARTERRESHDGDRRDGGADERQQYVPE